MSNDANFSVLTLSIPVWNWGLRLSIFSMLIFNRRFHYFGTEKIWSDSKKKKIKWLGWILNESTFTQFVHFSNFLGFWCFFFLFNFSSLFFFSIESLPYIFIPGNEPILSKLWDSRSRDWHLYFWRQFFDENP
jgi:hypothetical protein